MPNKDSTLHRLWSTIDLAIIMKTFLDKSLSDTFLPKRIIKLSLRKTKDSHVLKQKDWLSLFLHCTKQVSQIRARSSKSGENAKCCLCVVCETMFFQC